ncbi:MAG TPA: hypothetical protein VFP84_29590 [Kofleriaceae bacterium]|nr:hypothetical protein [Kofleriaceae bacterium]
MKSRVVLVSVLAAVGLAGCGEDRIEIRQSENADYNHGAMLQAVDKFVAAGRTPVAYGQLAQAAFGLRAGMDRSVARETELKLMVLALTPVQSVNAKPMAEQVNALALTVWPTLLAPDFEYDELLFKRDPNAGEWMPKQGENARGYLVRLCGTLLASDCKQVVPELQGEVIAAIATRRATERVRNAVSDCVMCGAEPGWHEAVRAWESLDRVANASITDAERRADPDNWPTAGEAAQLDPALPEAEVNETGEVVIGGQHYATGQRIAALHDLRGDSDAIALHLRPDLSLAQVRALLGDVRKSGASRVAVVARADRYPWERRVYWIADGTGTSTGLRPTDSLQLLLHAVDKVATPGAIARVD